MNILRTNEISYAIIRYSEWKTLMRMRLPALVPLVLAVLAPTALAGPPLAGPDAVRGATSIASEAALGRRVASAVLGPAAAFGFSVLDAERQAAARGRPFSLLSWPDATMSAIPATLGEAPRPDAGIAHRAQGIVSNYDHAFGMTDVAALDRSFPPVPAVLWPGGNPFAAPRQQ